MRLTPTGAARPGRIDGVDPRTHQIGRTGARPFPHILRMQKPIARTGQEGARSGYPYGIGPSSLDSRIIMKTSAVAPFGDQQRTRRIESFEANIVWVCEVL